MLQDHRNTKKQGDHGLGAAIYYFSKSGHTVSLSLTDSQEYDLIVDIDGRLLRTQVKTTSYKSEYGVYSVSLTVKGGNRSGTGKIKKLDKSKVDAIFVLTDENEAYFIPTSEFPGNSSVNLGDNVKAYKCML